MAELTRTERWRGARPHAAGRDEVVVASRWSCRGTRRAAAGTLETNNDTTERKRAEDALQQTQTELAHSCG